ncbi:MAG: DUF1697 domain-containing protein [Anaerolineaceae bacterium]|jgi:uncharacterized protein (DUF1697 family)|nr:DUF1697 domain-containing protein [Anaerolineaceae bacterium]
MNTFVALFRGINVGGHNMLPMRELKDILAGIGLQDIATYIQSGNVVFTAEQTDTAVLSQTIREAVAHSHGFAPQVLLLTAEELAQAAAANPYPEAGDEPKTVHLYFLEEAPSNPDLKKLAALKLDNEHFMLINKVFYLYAPDGIGRSKLAAGVEKALGVAVTARNWRSVGKILEMVQ